MLSRRVVILIGTETIDRICAIFNGFAPYLDYRLIATQLQPSIVLQWAPLMFTCGFRQIDTVGTLFRNLCRAIGLVSTLAPRQLVYSTGETWGIPFGMAGMFRSKPSFVHVVYAHRVFSPNWLRFLHLSRRWLAIDGWICVTSHQAQLLQDALAPAALPVAVIPQGVDTTFFDPMLATPPDNKPYLLSIGAEMRNYDLLFASVLNSDAEVVVKATSAWMSGGRKSQTAPIPPNVKLITTHMSYIELRNLYAGAELVIVPLYDTPQAAGITTILEAMAMRKCVVATRSAGLPDILVDNVTGVVTDPTPESLADAITALRMDSPRREALALAGQQAVLSSATIEHHAQHVADFLLAVHNRVR